MKTGDQLGKWTLIESLGAGGNGTVWRCSDSTGSDAALKALTNVKDRERLGRFRNEIDFLRGHTEVPGILPILDYELGGERDAKPWYVMPVAVPVRKMLGKDSDTAAVVAGMASVAATLAALAELGAFHRDVKPDNLLVYRDRWCVSDFGLVKHPDSRPLTEHGRKLGPANFMAPEMRENADTADAGAADVYALAKTLWVLLADQNLPLPGQHRADDEMCQLMELLASPRAPELDLLIERCTANNPLRRPKMHEVAAELDAMLRSDQTVSNEVDTAALEIRIAQVTEVSRRKAEARDKHHDHLDLGWVRLVEEIGRPLLADLGERLRSFTVREGGSLSVVPPAALATLPMVQVPGRTSWSAMLHSPDGSGTRVDLGLFLRAVDDTGRCVIAACLSVNRYNEGRGLAVQMAEPVVATVVPSAHFDQAVQSINSQLLAAIPELLGTVAEFLDAEQASRRTTYHT